MGKRKRICDQNKTPPPPETMPYSSIMDLSKEKSSHSVDSGTLKSLSSIMDCAGKLPNTHHSHQNLGRTRGITTVVNTLGVNSINNADASSSRGKGTLHNEKLSFKFASQCNSDSGRHIENKERAFCRPEKIRPSSLAVGAASPDALKMVTRSLLVISRLWRFWFVGMFIMPIVWNREHAMKIDVIHPAHHVRVCSRSLTLREGTSECTTLYSVARSLEDK
ncbi:hypothetical protein HYC85_016101 [Camellia sinensis]|uniref:Uncharacterized protein n=1 Tax=Camellia sinensis TaxID=4442 RepID=A0A7J7GYM0_CAMSI|nr:hypothetical protein HYC85_016101 [Camellia sinensis]